MMNDALSGFLGAYAPSSAARIAANTAAEDRAAELEARTRKALAERLSAVQALGEARLQAGDRIGAEALGTEAIGLQNKVFGLNLTGNQIQSRTEETPAGQRRVIGSDQDPILRANLGLQQPKPVFAQPGQYRVDPQTGQPLSYLPERLSPNVAAQVAANEHLAILRQQADRESDARRTESQMAIAGAEIGSRERIAQMQVEAQSQRAEQRQPSLQHRNQGGFIIYTDPRTGTDVGYRRNPSARFDAEAFRKNWLAGRGYDPRIGSFILQGDTQDAKDFRAALQAEQSMYQQPPQGLREITGQEGSGPQRQESPFRELQRLMRSSNPNNPAAQRAGAAGTRLPASWDGQIVSTGIGPSFRPSRVTRSSVNDFRSLPAELHATFGASSRWSVRSEAQQRSLNTRLGRRTVNSWHGYGKALDIPVPHPILKVRIMNWLLERGYGVIDEGDHLHASPDGR